MPAPKHLIGVLFDMETSGLIAGQNEPVSMAAKAIDLQTFQELDRFPLRVMQITRPEHWGERAEQVHGYSREYLAEHGEHPAKVTLEFLNWCASLTQKYSPARPEETKILLGGHNTVFDIGFLKALITDHKVSYVVPAFSWDALFDYHIIDTFMLFYFVKVLVQRVEKYARLVNATAHYGIPHNAHNAEGDVEACHQVLLKLVEEFGADLTKAIPDLAPITGDEKAPDRYGTPQLAGIRLAE